MNPDRQLAKEITHLEQEIKSLKTTQGYLLNQNIRHTASTEEIASVNAYSSYIGANVDSLYAIVSFHGVNADKKAIARPLFAARVQPGAKLNFLYYPVLWRTYANYANILTFEIYVTGYDSTASETKPFEIIVGCRANMPGTMKVDVAEAWGGWL